MESFNPSSQEYKEVKDLPKEEQGNEVDIEGGFVRKDQKEELGENMEKNSSQQGHEDQGGIGAIERSLRETIDCEKIKTLESEIVEIARKDKENEQSPGYREGVHEQPVSEALEILNTGNKESLGIVEKIKRKLASTVVTTGKVVYKAGQAVHLPIVSVISGTVAAAIGAIGTFSSHEALYIAMRFPSLLNHFTPADISFGILVGGAVASLVGLGMDFLGGRLEKKYEWARRPELVETSTEEKLSRIERAKKSGLYQINPAYRASIDALEKKYK